MAAEDRRVSHGPAYFLISVSTHENLELCIRYGLAGFLSGENGAWTFCEVAEGDFVSFLYGAKAHNLYRVARRDALCGAEKLPPWSPLTFRESGKVYAFPFRLHLELIREFTESLVRAEFAYVAENLLLRGGYRKTHFQADQTTLQSASEMGNRSGATIDPLDLPEHKSFILKFTRNAKLACAPEICRFKEPILQAAIRRHLSSTEKLQGLLDCLNMDARAEALEILGEKALPQGFIDLLLKRRVPLGSSWKVPIEVKTKQAGQKDLNQLLGYMKELGGDCPGGILIGAGFGRQLARQAASQGARLVRYSLKCDLSEAPTFEEICRGLDLEAF